MTGIGDADGSGRGKAAAAAWRRLLTAGRAGFVAVALWLISGAAADAQDEARGLDPRAAKARLVLNTHCARCHQRDHLQRPAPAREIGDILDLDRIASDPSLVVPGNADASLLYSLMVRREMPPGAPLEASPGDPPTSAEVDALRDWIEALPLAGPATCPTRARLDGRDVGEAAGVAIEKAGEAGSDLRFVSLAHLFNTCVSDLRLGGYRQAVSKVLNSVSRSAAPLRPAPIDPSGMVLAVRLSELGWTAEDWDLVLRGTPVVTGLPAALAKRVVPADALAAALVTPRVYSGLLRLAPTLDDQLGALGLDRSKAEQARPARRIGLKSSQMSRGHRLIEQLDRPSGSVWLVYDFAGSDGPRDLTTHPLGPGAVPSDGAPFKPDAVRVMFNLPNGFAAFAVYDASGLRLDAVPAEVSAPAMASVSERSAPSGCISCHDGGPRKAADTIREAALASASTLPKSVRDAVALLYPPASETDPIFATDSLRYRAALRAAGVDPELTIDGLEPVTALARTYHRPVARERLSEDAGEPVEALLKRLEAAGDAARMSAARLRMGGALPRIEANRLLAPMAPEGAAAAADGDGQASPLFDLTLLSDKRRYDVGEQASFSVRSSFDCNLTLISVNVAGKATVVFPNDFEPDNALKAGTILHLPAEGSPYRFRLTHPGKERMIAVCTTVSKMADGIRQDYEKQRFTALGDWRNFLRAIVDDETPDISSQDKAEARSKGRSAARGKSREEEQPKRIRMEPQARTAIDYVVEDKP